MSHLYFHYQCPAPRCEWESELTHFIDENHANTERILNEHINTHRIYRHVMRLHVWWAARGGKK